jgi:hypothetical protein
MKQSRFTIDGEICVLDVQGISDFNALHSSRHNDEAQLYAFDLVSIENDDLRDMPLFERKVRLGKLLKGRPEGIFVAPFEAGETGRDCSKPPAAWDSRVWSQSTASGGTDRAPATGSRSRTGSIRLSAASWISSDEDSLDLRRHR